MSNDTNFTTGDEPLLGDVAPLSDEAWDGLLEETFMAPPGAADHLIDSLDPSESADYETDAATDDAQIDADAAATGADLDFGYGADADEIDPDDDLLDELSTDEDATDESATPASTTLAADGADAPDPDAPFGFTDLSLDLDEFDAGAFDATDAGFESEPHLGGSDAFLETTELSTDPLLDADTETPEGLDDHDLLS